MLAVFRRSYRVRCPKAGGEMALAAEPAIIGDPRNRLAGDGQQLARLFQAGREDVTVHRHAQRLLKQPASGQC